MAGELSSDLLTYWSRPAAPLPKSLETSQAGLAGEEAAARPARLGPNRLREQIRGGGVRFSRTSFAAHW